MPFTTETARDAQKKGNKIKEKIKGDRFKWIVNRGMDKATNVLNEMLEGVEVTKQQAEAVKLLEKYVGYEKAKKTATDLTSDGKELNPVLVKFIKE